MSCFHRCRRVLITALTLSLLLSDGLAVLPGHAELAGHVVVAANDATVADETAGDSAGGDTLICASGFDQVDSKLGMSLHGVALVGQGALAVGYARRGDDDDFGRRTPATLINSNGQWTRIRTSSPGREDGLMAVDSRTGAGTWAVGWTTINGRVMPLALRWTGSDWKTDRPTPHGALPAVFTDVTVMGDGSPLAVGYRMTASGKRQPIALRKDGRRWSNLPVRIGRRESVTFTGVTPDRRGGLWVVGHGGPGAEIHPVIYRRENKKWRRVSVPRLGGEAALTDIEVVSDRGDAWAVGYHHHGGRSDPLVLRWNGKSWRDVAAPVFDSKDVLLTAVTADPGGGVWVVGAAWDDAHKCYEAVAAWWDGQAWNQFAGRAGGTELHDVVGALDGNGWAVGRSGQSARATRVCTPAQAGIFGGALPGDEREPRPTPGLTASGVDQGAAVAAAEVPAVAEALAVPAIAAGAGTPGEAGNGTGGTGSALQSARNATPEFIRQATRKSSRKPSARQRARSRRATGIKVGTLPAPSADKSVVARDVALSTGVFEETGTYGAVVADFDGDGVDDIFLGRHGRRGLLLLNRDGRFVQHTALRMTSIDRHGCTAADIDGSGLPDLYCAVGGKRGSGLKSNELWLDPGGPDPVEVAADRGLSDPTGRGRLATFLTARRQDEVNLVLANSPTRVDGLPSVGRAFSTDGDGRFKTRVRPGFASRLGALAMQAGDIDNDGREDLLLLAGGLQAPEQGGTRLYRNTRRGLVDVTRKLGVRSIDSVDAGLVDVNKDGKLDLVQLSPTMLRVSVMKKGKFRKVYQRRLSYGSAIASGDANGDGKSDLYIVRSNGTRNQPDVMLLNGNGGGRWSSVLIPQATGGAGDDAYAIDHDGNGLDDFLVLNGHNKRGPVQLIAFYPR